MGFFPRTSRLQSPRSSDPVLSIIVTVYFLILLYFPHFFFDLFVSPVFFITVILTSVFMEMGSTQREGKVKEKHKEITHLKARKTDSRDKDVKWMSIEADMAFSTEIFSELSDEWDRRAPLEVIFEEYEGEEEEDDEESSPETEEGCEMDIERLVSSAPYCTDTDTGSSSDGGFLAIDGWDSPENSCFKWEDEGESLIEIPLEEDNLIEIDLLDRGVVGN